MIDKITNNSLKIKQHNFNNRQRPKILVKKQYLQLLLCFFLIKFAATQQQLEDSSYYYIGCYTERTDLLKESIYAKTPQSCVEICEHQKFSYAVLSSEQCFCSNELNAEERQDEQLCHTRCLANKSQYCGGVGMHSYYLTMLGNEPAPNQLRITNATENSLAIMWQQYEPKKYYMTNSEIPSSQQQITNFLIKSQLLHTYSTLPFFQQPKFIVQSTENSFEITDLHPATQYNISVDALCGENVCGSAALIGNTLIGEPNPLPKQPKILTKTDSTITIEIDPIHNDNGPVTKLLIIVEIIDDSLSQPFDTKLLGDWQKSQDDGLPYYICAELDYQQPDSNRTRNFTIGDNKRYGNYQNPPLNNKESHVHISFGIVSTLNDLTKMAFTRSSHDQHTMTLENFTYATFESGQQSLIALIITCIVFGICFVLSLFIYLYLRYRTWNTRGNQRHNIHEMTLQQPIIERENNGFVAEDELPTAENFQQKFNGIVNDLNESKRFHRNLLRMNVNDVLAEGRYGEVISGKVTTNESKNCQLHIISLDELSSNDQVHLLHDFRKLTKLQMHEHILDFYGISASADWFYLIFEYQTLSLKQHLINNRGEVNHTIIRRLTNLTEELILQWIYDLANALEYLSVSKLIHKQICSHNIFINAESKLKLSIFGPIMNANKQHKIDIMRWSAPEVIRYQRYSIKSDVWSFACVAWECCTLGGTLYDNIINSNDTAAIILETLRNGSRPIKPSFIYQDLYQLFLNCWQLEPSERINFDEITFNIRQLMTSPKHALNFDLAGNTSIEILPPYLPLLEIKN